MMPGVVAGFPRKAETPGEYVITVGTSALPWSSARGYSGYSGDIANGPFGSVTPQQPSADAGAAGGNSGQGEIMAVCYEVSTINILVRGVTSLNQVGFSTIIIGGNSVAKSDFGIINYDGYSALRLFGFPDVFSSPTLEIKLIA